MALEAVTSYPQKGVAQVNWLLDSGEAGDAAQIARWHEKAVQIATAVGTSTVTIEGSNDGVTWATLFSKASATGTNVPLETLGAGVYSILENPLFIRPVAAAGDTDDISVILVGVAFD